jgi:hypothetical protein
MVGGDGRDGCVRVAIECGGCWRGLGGVTCNRHEKVAASFISRLLEAVKDVAENGLMQIVQSDLTTWV